MSSDDWKRQFEEGARRRAEEARRRFEEAARQQWVRQFEEGAQRRFQEAALSRNIANALENWNLAHRDPEEVRAARAAEEAVRRHMEVNQRVVPDELNEAVERALRIHRAERRVREMMEELENREGGVFGRDNMLEEDDGGPMVIDVVDNKEDELLQSLSRRGFRGELYERGVLRTTALNAWMNVWENNERVRRSGNGVWFENVRRLPHSNRDVGAYAFDLNASGVIINPARLYESILQYVRFAQDLDEADRIQVLLGDTRYPGEVFASTVLTLLGMISVDRIMELITDMLEYDRGRQGSERGMRAWNHIQIRITYIRTPRGNGYLRYATMSEFIKSKRCIVEVKERVKCGYVALMLGIKYFEGKDVYKDFRRSVKSRRESAERLYNQLGLGRDMIRLDDFDKIEKQLKVSIIVIAGVGLSIIRKPVYSDEKNQTIPLLMVDEHYHFVPVDYIGALWSMDRFCMKCMKAYRSIHHPCVQKCNYCKRIECKEAESTPKVQCEKCNFTFLGFKCKNGHKCTRKRCLTCGYIFVRSEAHKCFQRKCKRCKKWFQINIGKTHECYIQTIDEKSKKDTDEIRSNTKYLVYDYECMQDAEGVHYPSVIVAAYLYSDKVFVFSDNDTFCTWLFGKKHRGYTCIAHNGGKYDVHFIKQFMLRNNLVSDDIVKGNTIFYSFVKGLKMRFVDSYKLIPIALRNFPKTFGLKNVTKGYFPYRFYSPENRNYIGKIPDVKYFEFHNLPEADAKSGLEWYKERENDVYNIHDEVIMYCRDDVRVLKEGCEEYREWIMQISGDQIDPLQEMTIAGVCMKLYRTLFMPPWTIAVLDQLQDEFFYETRDAWVAYMERRINRPLERDMEGCDGFDPVEKKVYALLNCLDNGCSSCFNAHKVHEVKQLRMFELRHELTLRIDAFKEKGMTTYFVWQCKFRMSSEFKSFQTEFAKTRIGALRVRDAFFGGRTEPIHLYYKCNEDEEIVYEDASSMYPSVQSGFQRGLTRETYNNKKQIYYPVGHPIKITSDFKEISAYFGIIKCRVTCPQDLFLPVLPERKNGKLMFDLTPKIGTWVIEEILLALEHGYVVEEIYEIWHWEEKTTELFSGYVKCFIRMKIAASGWPDECKSEEEKRIYLDGINREEGIEPLKIEDIENNPGKRFIAKMALNNLWGKFGQQAVYGNIKDTFSEEEFYKYVCNDEIEITDVILHADIVRTLRYVKRSEFENCPGTTNVVLAAFTTAHARIRIYEALLLTGKNTLYMDTDSVIYVRKKGEPVIHLGPYLGDFTNELGTDEYIVEFVSTGPKSYAYVTSRGKVYLKVKGFTLNAGAKQVINMDLMKSMVLSDKSLKVLTKPLQFLIDKHHGIKTKVLSESEGKEFGMTFDKRFIEFQSELCVRTQPFDESAMIL